MNVDNNWFYGLRGLERPGYVNPVYLSTKEKVRVRWDEVIDEMLAYLNDLSDAELYRPFEEGLEVWQVLFHVLNHGTDHRAQMLAMLNQLGVKTFPQDYALYLLGRI